MVCLFYSIMPFALTIGVYGQLSLVNKSSDEAIELLDPFRKTFSFLK